MTRTLDRGPLSDPEPSKRRPAVFLDRDGTMIKEAGYLSRLEDVQWFPGTKDAIRLLNRAGYLVIVITNQGGIALGKFDDAFVRMVHGTMDAELAQSGAHVDGWYYCPHHPNGVIPELSGPCACRKPGHAMIINACADFEIDVARSWVIGDRERDVAMAPAVGARGILVRTGYGDEEAARALPPGTLVVANLNEAVAEVLTR